MVLLAASVCTKDGKALVSRQFVEMTKARIEGLIVTFPKLLGEGKQHTFVETESVRYVYQPLEQLYVLLITTKASNILEDLETLRLFARVIPEYACGTDEADILNNAFQIIFAFDEIVALGYREDVNFSQIRTYTEMDSHEERVFRAVQESKEREAKELMKQRARDLQLARQEAAKRGTAGSGLNSLKAFKGTSTGFGSDTAKPEEPRVVVMRDRFGNENPDLSSSTTASNLIPSVKRSGMQLGGGRSGAGAVDQFVDRLKAEGEAVNDDLAKLLDGTTLTKSETGERGRRAVSTFAADTKAVKKEDLHLRIEEKLIVQAGRDGGLEQMEVQGIMQTLAASTASSDARIHVDTTEALNPRNERQPAAQLQTHPNLDKKAFLSTSWLQIKPGGKSFPIEQEVGVLRWRLQTQDESVLPITINCWPNEIRGGFEVNIEYELQNTELELHDVCLSVPLPPNSKSPAVGNFDGDYEVNSRKTQLDWRLPLIDASSPSGSIEFTLSTERGATADQFFPLKLTLHAAKSICGIRVIEASDPQGRSVPFSTETRLYAEKYEIV
ncbi:Coatomer subunit delta [Paragonimus heterotremus]|uniref:Coatomer subunit delta n=2 Tax=Paragonimus TaxID=34503 RepID=A0A8J4X100_9TREM|nr:Coatomer subunit delta [Paragonimus heterotremus]